MSEFMQSQAKSPNQIEKNSLAESYFGNTLIPQLLIDGTLHLLKFSPAAKEHFKLTLTDVDTPIESIESLNFPGLIDNIKSVLDNGNSIDVNIESPNKRFYKVNIIPVQESDENRKDAVIISLVEITSHIAVLRELERLNADHEIFTYTISHDLRTPVANFVLLVYLLKEVYEDKNEFLRLIGILNKSAGQLTTMIEQLTDARITQTDTIKPEPVSLMALLDEVKLVLHDKLSETKTVITTNLLVPEINFPSRNLRSILHHLVGNAMAFKSPERAPEIFIRTEKTDGYTRMYFSDNGIGLEPGKEELIFSQFTRMHQQTEYDGVGMYIVSRMLNKYQGKIEVSSTPGQGTTFTLYFKN